MHVLIKDLGQQNDPRLVLMVDGLPACICPKFLTIHPSTNRWFEESKKMGLNLFSELWREKRFHFVIQKNYPLSSAQTHTQREPTLRNEMS
jgi:hypothetical protein